MNRKPKQSWRKSFKQTRWSTASSSTLNGNLPLIQSLLSLTMDS
jgi:hypothetical protein